MEEITLHAECRECGSVRFLNVDEWAYAEWRERRLLAQEAFPNLDACDRELLISNTCGDCWGNAFGDDCVDFDLDDIAI